MEDNAFNKGINRSFISRRFIIVRVGQLFCIITGIISFLLTFYGYDYPFTIESFYFSPWGYLLMAAYIYQTILTIISVFVLKHSFNWAMRLVFWGAFIPMGLSSLLYGGIFGGNIYMLIWVIAIVYVFFTHNKTEAIVYVCLHSCLWLFSVYHTELTLDPFLKSIYYNDAATMHQDGIHSYLYSSTIGFVIFLIIVFVYGRRTEKLEERLAGMVKRNDQLLKSVFPESIVERIYKSGSTTIHDAFKDVCVLFADLTNFSSISTTISPEILVSELNAIYKGIDSIAQKYGVEKIKTIGDGYLAICGAPEYVEDAQKCMVCFGIDVLRFIEVYKQTSAIPELGIRIGIDTGPVVAGIIGIHRQTYDIWGATVNRASRFESYGVAGKLNVSEAVYKAVALEFPEARHWFPDLKGFGKTSAYLLD